MSIFSLNMYKYPQHQYYHHQLKYHRHIRIMQSFSYNQLKFFLKHFLKIMELHFLRIFRFKFAYFNMMNKYINIRPIIMQTKTKVLTLLSKIYRIFFFCSQGRIVLYLHWTFIKNYFFFIIRMHRCIHMCTKYYDVFTKLVTTR